MSILASRKRDQVFPSRVAGASSLCFILLAGQCAPLLANPTGGSVVAGAATIGAAGNTLTVTQSTNTAIINWATFSIANGESTKFLVPSASGATLNFVTGGSPSSILGSLSSNGQLFLINPSGIVVGATGRIDTAGFVGSTLAPNSSNFLGSNLTFSGTSTAGVDNQGVINANGGSVYLIANQVSNEGTLYAPKGSVGMAAGSNVLLAQSGDQHLFVQSNPLGTSRAVGVTNAGTIKAASVELRAAGGNAYALAINNTGSIAATGYKKINGQVYLTADTGVISNSGSIRATGRHHGGKVSLLSKTGTITNTGTINVSATGTGGVGGSVLLSSMGGKASNTGVIDALGGTDGTGGAVDISGATVDFASGQVSTLAPGGATGTFTIDPADYTVAASGGDITGPALGTDLESNNMVIQASDTLTVDDNIIWTSTHTLTLETTGTTGTSIINIEQEINGQSGGLIIDGSAGTQVSDTGAIDVNSFVMQGGSWVQNSASLPAFTAISDFELQGTSSFLRVTGGNGSTGNPYQITDIYGLEGLASPSGAYLTSSAELMNDINASSTASWNTNTGWVPIGSYDGVDSTDSYAYSGVFDGQGHTISGLTLMNAIPNSLGLFGDTSTTAIIKNVNLTGVNISGGDYVGALVGFSNGEVLNSTSAGTVSGGSGVGGLVGISEGLVSGSSSSGTVSGGTNDFDVGGLVGSAATGTITNSSSSATVGGYSAVGGLVGYNSNATISADSATGSVTGSGGSLGGLVGFNLSLITGSSSSASVVGTGTTVDDIGGLVGFNDGTITSSYSTSPVTTTTGSYVGGLVGDNDSGTVTLSYATGAVSGVNFVGGLAGWNSALISNSFATGEVTGSGTDIGGLTGHDYVGTTIDSYSAGQVHPTGTATNVGGLVGLIETDGTSTFTNDFWDSTTAGVSFGVGGGQSATGILGITTANLMSQSYITATATSTPMWDFSTVWTTNSGTTIPQLIGVNGPGGTAGNGSMDLLSGTAFINSGTTAANGVTLTFLYNGTATGTVTTSSTGSFTFDINSTDVGGGLLIVDATDNGNTYFQSNSSATSFTNVDIWGNTLRIDAVTASNSALKTAIGNLTGGGINYSVSGSNLIANSNTSIYIGSHYTLDGNVTTPGTFTLAPGATLTGSVGATISANSMALGGTVNDTGTVSLSATGTIVATGSVTVGGFDLLGGTWAQMVGQNGLTSLPTFSDSGNFALASGSVFERFAGGAGTISNPYQVADVFGLQGVGTLLGDAFVLANGIDASPAANWNSGAGFAPIGSSTAPFTGYFSGNTYEISNLVVNLTGSGSNAGLFGYTGTAARVEQVSLSNASITGGNTGNSNAGAVVAYNDGLVLGGIITGTVTSTSTGGDNGGAVGVNYGTVENVTSQATVSGDGQVGGLIGENDGTVEISSATGNVTGGADSRDVGGLVGDNAGTLLTSFATGSVNGYGGVGGLAGFNYNGDTIMESYATGSVTGGVSTIADENGVGGLVGVNIGTVETTYSIGAVSGTGTTSVGGLIGSDSSGASVLASYWANSVGSNGSLLTVGQNSGSIDSYSSGKSLTQLMQQSTFQPSGSSVPDWNFSGVWTTNGNTTTPQFASDTLSGTAYQNAGSIISPGVNVELISGGNVVNTVSTGTNGVFSFTFSGAYIGAGLVLTDATDNGSTYFQSNSNATAFTGVDIWGNSLRIQADTADNAALKTAIGTLTGNGINFAVDGSNNLTAGAGTSIDIVKNYAVDGNITTGNEPFNALSGSTLTGTTTASATITGDTVFVNGNLNDTFGALTFVSTSGVVQFSGVGSSGAPAVVDGLTLTSAASIQVYGSYITLPTGNLAMTGTGYTSTSDQYGDPDGIDIFNSSFVLSGGNATLTGVAGYNSPGTGVLDAGTGVSIGSDGSTQVAISTTGSGNITIHGLDDNAINSSAFSSGVILYTDSTGSSTGTSTTNVISVANGLLTITGTVTGVTGVGTSVNGASIGGVAIENGTEVVATGSGSVAITGDTSGATTDVNGGNFSFIQGVEVQGLAGVNSGTLTITGSAGTLNTTSSTINAASESSDGEDGLPQSVGVVFDGGNLSSTENVESGAGSTVHITGTGGRVTTTGSFTGKSRGVAFGSSSETDFGMNPPGTSAMGGLSGSTVTITGTGGSVNTGYGSNSGDAETTGVHIAGEMALDDGGSLTITGQGGALDDSHAAPGSGTNLPITQGVRLNGGSQVVGRDTATIAIVGTGGAVTAGGNTTVGSVGVNIGDDNDNGTATLDDEYGTLSVTGTGGSSPSLGVGVLIYGFDGGGASIDDSAYTQGGTPSLTINGTGGSGYTGSGTVTGNYVPNAGVLIADNASISSGEDASIQGAGGANSDGVDVLNLGSTDPTLDTEATDPNISGNNISITSTAGNLLIEGEQIDPSNSFTFANTSATGGISIQETGSGGLQATDYSITANGPILINNTIYGFGTDNIISTNGNITLGTNGAVNDDGYQGGEGPPNVLTIAAGTNLPHSHYIINNSSLGAGAITATDGAVFDLYQADSVTNTLGGVTVPTNNVVYGVSYPDTSLPTGNGELFYVAAANDVGPNAPGNTNTNTGSGDAPGSGSNLVPPAIVPQNNPNPDGGNTDPGTTPGTGSLATIWGGSVIPPFSFTGGTTSQTGGGSGGLASSSGNGGLIGAGDAAVFSGGGLTNIPNEAAYTALDFALGPGVHYALDAALAALGDWTDANFNPNDNGDAGGATGEILLKGGDVVIISGNGVKSIPLSQVPPQLKNALDNGVRHGLSGGH